MIIASALVISAAIGRSGVIEDAMRPLLPLLQTARTQVPVLVGATMLMSMVTKNIGALAIFMPVASQVAKRSGVSISRLLMPMSFASLMGGLVTLVGTSPNIIVSKTEGRSRRERIHGVGCISRRACHDRHRPTRAGRKLLALRVSSL